MCPWARNQAHDVDEAHDALALKRDELNLRQHALGRFDDKL